MGVRPLVLTVVLQAMLAAPPAVAQSLHLSPPGTLVSGSFELAGKRIPLPTGEFVLGATQPGSVFLAQLDGQRLRVAVWASADADTGEPCAADCARVEERRGDFGPNAAGILKEAAGWLAYHDVVLPVPVTVVAEITHVAPGELLRVSYAFNPWSYGCKGGETRFRESVAAWGEGVRKSLEGSVEASGGGIHQCVSALAGAAARY
jgi:hypothetical protein